MRDRYASLREGLVGAWIPSVSGSGLLLPDLSGQGNNGTLTNMDASDWVSGQYGRALDFDGVNDRVQVATKGVVTTNRSVSVWFKTSVVFPSSSYGVICRWGTASSFPADIGKDFQVLFGTDGNLGSTGIGISQYGDAVAVSGYNDGKWHHGYFEGKGSLYSIYIDGVFKASKTMTTNATAGTVSIGYGPAGYFPGLLDDVRIYNRALSEPEIKLLSQEPGVGFKRTRSVFDFGRKPAYLPPTPTDYRTVRVKQTEHASLREGLVGAWCPSIEGNGYTLPDLSGQGNNGTLTNMGPEDWVSSHYGRALDFDGVNDQVLIGAVSSFSFIQNTHVWSCSTWFTLSSTASAQFISGNTPFSSSDKGFALYYETGRGIGNGVIRSGVTRGSGLAAQTYQFRSPDNSIADTNWHHVCAGMNGPGLPFVYIDGVQQSITLITSDTTLSSGDSTRQLGLGYAPFTSILTPLAGSIDDIRIYNRALSEPEIKLLASRPGIGLRPQRRTMYYAPPTGARRRRILTSMP